MAGNNKRGRAAKTRSAAGRGDDNYYNYINSGQYSYSSQAYQLQPLEENEEYSEAPARVRRPVTQPKPSQKPAQKSKQKVKPAQRSVRKQKANENSQYKIEISGQRRRSFLSYMAFVVIFAGAFLCVFSVAYVDQKKLELSTVQKERKEAYLQNIILRGEILDSYDLSEVEIYATTMLGMIKPQKSQIIHISVPRVSYIVLNEAETEEQGFSLLSSLENMAKSLFRTEKKQE